MSVSHKAFNPKEIGAKLLIYNKNWLKCKMFCAQNFPLTCIMWGYHVKKECQNALRDLLSAKYNDFTNAHLS